MVSTLEYDYYDPSEKSFNLSLDLWQGTDLFYKYQEEEEYLSFESFADKPYSTVPQFSSLMTNNLLITNRTLDAEVDDSDEEDEDDSITIQKFKYESHVYDLKTNSCCLLKNCIQKEIG